MRLPKRKHLRSTPALTSRLNTNAIRDKELLEKAHQDKLDLYKENNEIKYYDYVGKLQESALLQEKHKFDELTQLLGASLQDREAMEKAYQDKKMLAEQQGYNKVKQSNLEVTRAKLKFDSMEYQSAKEVFANSAALMQSKNKFLFNLGKALSSASAIMNAAESITKIWAVWGECPPIAAAFSAISAAVTGVQINTIAATKLPSYQKGKLPVFAEGYYPADHFPAMIGAKEAVITAESTRANSGLIQEMFKNPGKSVGGGGVVVNQNNNFNGNVMSKDFVNSHVIPHLETVARYQGKQLFSEKNK